MNKTFDQRIKDIEEKRKRKAERLRRNVEMGYIKGKVHPNGMVETFTPKGIQNWYTTKQLVTLVEAAFKRNMVVDNKQVCWINGRWQLQIRGKHLRRLLKAMPEVKQEGRKLVRFLK